MGHHVGKLATIWIVIGQRHFFLFGLFKKRVITYTVLVDFYRAVVYFTHSLHLNMVAMAILHSLAIKICCKIFRNVMLKVVSVFSLEHVKIHIHHY